MDNGLTVRTAFSVKPGTYVVRLVVRDNEGQHDFGGEWRRRYPVAGGFTNAIKQFWLGNGSRFDKRRGALTRRTRQDQDKSKPPVDSGTVIKTETRLVVVDAVVTDKKDNYVKDLNQERFQGLRGWQGTIHQDVLLTKPTRRRRLTGRSITWFCSSITPP